MAKKKPAKAVAVPAPQFGVSIPPQKQPQAQAMMPIEGAITNAGGANIVWAGNDCTLVFTRPRPTIMADGSVPTHSMAEVVAIIQLSAATMKDLSVIISETLAKYEKVYGPIETLLTKARTAKKKSSTQH